MSFASGAIGRLELLSSGQRQPVSAAINHEFVIEARWCNKLKDRPN